MANLGTLLSNAVILADPPEDNLVEVIKTARHPNVEIDYDFTSFSLTSIAHSNGGAEK